MPAVNSGKPIRIKDGSILTITKSTTDYTVSRLDEGTFRFVKGGHEVIHVYDGAALDPDAGLIQGDEQPSTVEFSVRPTKTGMTGSNDLSDLLEQVFTNGVGVPVAVKLQIPDYQGATSGTQYLWSKCFLNASGESYQGSGGGDVDRVAFSLTDFEALPAVTTYSGA